MLTFEVTLHDQPRLLQFAEDELVAALEVIIGHHVPRTTVASLEEHSTGKAAAQTTEVAAEAHARVRCVLCPVDNI